MLDASYHSISGSGTTPSSKAMSVGASVGSATSALNFVAVEDLGGGMKAQVFYGIDPRAQFNNSANPLGRHEMYVGLSGSLGAIKLGSPNTAALSTHGAGQIFGTATGGAYTNITTASGSAVRFNNSVRYDTPVFNGFSASVNYAPGNNDATAQTTTLAAAPKVTDLGLAYTNGPLNVNFSQLSRSAVLAATAANQAAGNTGLAAVSASAKSTYTSLGANYSFGDFKVLAGYGKGDKSASGDLDSKLTTLGGSYKYGPNTLLVGAAKTTLGSFAARKATGIRYDRELSKRTVAYVVYESFNSGDASNNKLNTTAVGMRHSF